MYLVLLIKHVFFLACKTLLLWHLLDWVRNNVSLMSDIQNTSATDVVLSLNFVSAFNRYFFLILFSCLYFLKYWTVPLLLLLASYVFLPVPSPIYFLFSYSTVIFKRAFIPEHVTTAAFHCLSSEVYSPSNLFEKSPFLFFFLLSSGPLSFWSRLFL